MSTLRHSFYSAPRVGRRLAAWLAFGAVGLATGAVWATGFASSTAGNGTTDPSPAVTKTAPDGRHVGARAAPWPTRPALTFDWDRPLGLDRRRHGDVHGRPERRGSTTARPTTSRMLLANTSVLTGWASLQLEIERVDEAAGGTVRRRPTSTARPTPKVLNFDDEDAGVYWNGLAGDARLLPRRRRERRRRRRAARSCAPPRTRRRRRSRRSSRRSTAPPNQRAPRADARPPPADAPPPMLPTTLLADPRCGASRAARAPACSAGRRAAPQRWLVLADARDGRRRAASATCAPGRRWRR